MTQKITLRREFIPLFAQNWTKSGGWIGYRRWKWIFVNFLKKNLLTATLSDGNHGTFLIAFLPVWFSSHFISWFFILLSGARMLYKNLPRAVGLRRITLHKSLNLKNEVVYFLLVECSNFMDHIGEAANLLPVLRARICGYTGIFRCVDSFWQEPPLPMTKSSKLTFEETATEEVRLLAEGDTQNR